VPQALALAPLATLVPLSLQGPADLPGLHLRLLHGDLQKLGLASGAPDPLLKLKCGHEHFPPNLAHRELAIFNLATTRYSEPETGCDTTDSATVSSCHIPQEIAPGVLRQQPWNSDHRGGAGSIAGSPWRW
jgi:hypothetical protein